MPLYEYTCEACGAHVEKLQNRGAEPPQTCPECSETGTLKRGISKTSFHLKGGGWYVTDYAGATDSSGPAPDAGASAGGGSEEAASAPEAASSGAVGDAGGDTGGGSSESSGGSGDDSAA